MLLQLFNYKKVAKAMNQVSIPQAVGVVATLEEGQVLAFKDGVFQYRKR